jgi:hypothetical protein
MSELTRDLCLAIGTVAGIGHLPMAGWRWRAVEKLYNSRDRVAESGN